MSSDLLAIVVAGNCFQILEQKDTLEPQTYFYDVTHDDHKPCIDKIVRFMTSSPEAPSVKYVNGKFLLEPKIENSNILTKLGYSNKGGVLHAASREGTHVYSDSKGEFHFKQQEHI